MTKTNQPDNLINVGLTRETADEVFSILSTLYGHKPLGLSRPTYAVYDGTGVIFPVAPGSDAKLMKVWIIPEATTEGLDRISDVINRDTEFGRLHAEKKLHNFEQGSRSDKEGVVHYTRWSTNDLAAIENIFNPLIRAGASVEDLDSLHEALGAASEQLRTTRRVTGPAAELSITLAFGDDRFALGWRYEGSTFKCFVKTHLLEMRKPVVEAFRSGLNWRVVSGWLS